MGRDAPAVAGGVLVVGDVMTDVIVRPEGPLAHGSDRRAAIRMRPGGSGANQAAWLAHFGVATAFAAKVGEADRALQEAAIRARGITPFIRGDTTAATGMLVTLIDPDGQRSFLTDRGANEALDSADLPDAILDGIALLHISGYALFAERPRHAVLDLVRRARARGIALSIDPASSAFLEEVGPAAFLAWTQGASLCFPNDDEAAVLAGTRDEGLQRRRLATRYGLVVIKRGALGAEVVGPDGGCLCALPAVAVAAIDTTGAGDAFLAAFLAGHLARQPLETCLRHAIAAGTAATMVVGGHPPVPTAR